jgi:hypothetical protein
MKINVDVSDQMVCDIMRDMIRSACDAGHTHPQDWMYIGQFFDAANLVIRHCGGTEEPMVLPEVEVKA